MLRPNIAFESLANLFEDGAGITKDLLKTDVMSHLKATQMPAVGDTELEINFSPDDGSDILVERVDPEKSLGYLVHASEKDYFDHLTASMYVPTEADILGTDG